MYAQKIFRYKNPVNAEKFKIKILLSLVLKILMLSRNTILYPGR